MTNRFFLLIFFLAACSSSKKQLNIDGTNVVPDTKCGTRSYINHFAVYSCDSLELEDTNDHVFKSTPIHNISGAMTRGDQKLLVVDEKIFNVQLRENDQEVVCRRRLNVILNPGTGESLGYQRGWVDYQPPCFKFFKLRSGAQSNKLGL